jgi:hypothetical protein
VDLLHLTQGVFFMRNAPRFLGLFLVVGLIAGTASVSQAATLSLVGAADVSKPSQNVNTDTYGTKVGFGGGVLLDFRLMERTMFEIGGLYVNRKPNDTTLGVVTTLPAIQVPVLLRWYLNPMFSIGVGGYYADGQGNNYAASNLKTSDYGLVGSVGLRFPMTMTTRFLVDVRYDYGLTNVYTDPNSTGDTYKNRDLQALVGFQFALGMMR